VTKKTYKLSEVARCYRVCFLDKETQQLTQEGRVVIKDLRAKGLLDSDTFDENPYAMARNSGLMELANRIFYFVFTKAEQFERVEVDDGIEIEDGDDLINGNNDLEGEY